MLVCMPNQERHDKAKNCPYAGRKHLHIVYFNLNKNHTVKKYHDHFYSM